MKTVTTRVATPPDPIPRLLAVAATRPEGAWPEELDLDTFHRELGTIAPAARAITDLAEARRTRDAVAAILLDGTDDSAHRALDAIAEAHTLVPTVADGGVGLRPLRPTPVGEMWAEILLPLMRAVADGCRARIGRCASDPCITPYLDTTRARTRAYCCQRCATRDRVRRHRSEESS